MFDVTIYEKTGKRHMYDHVSQITNISDNVVMIRTKRKTTNYYHRDCIEKERTACVVKHS